MDIKAEEISKIIRDQIGSFAAEVDVAEVGSVVSIGDGIARVHGVEQEVTLGGSTVLLYPLFLAGCTTAVAPAAATASRPSLNGKNASEATTEPCRFPSPAFIIATFTESTRLI